MIGPYEYMHQHPGKDVRRQLIQAFDSWLQVPPDSLAIISKVVTMLHTASLLCVLHSSWIVHFNESAS